MSTTMSAIQEKVSQIQSAIQILMLVQPVLVSLFQFAESMFPSGGGATKMAYVKACIASLLADIPDLQAKFDSAWHMLSGLIEATLAIAKTAGWVKPVVTPVATPAV